MYIYIGSLQENPEHRRGAEREALREDEVLPLEGGRGRSRERQTTRHDADRPGALQEADPQQDRIRHADHIHSEPGQGERTLV